ncbi:MAG: histidinol dehydrogenase [Pseudomonadota bacterium]
MPHHLDTRDAGFEASFARLLAARDGQHADVEAAVASILADVAARGDAAVLEATARFDRLDLRAPEMRVGAEEMEAACAAIPPAERAALSLAAERIEAYHKRQRPEDATWRDPAGVTLGWRWRPLDAVGLYVPGGLASYPSSVLMNAIPARVAGVGRVAICAPSPDGRLNPLVLLAARLSGVEEVYRIGGAQAIGALAHGTQTIPAVDKITGPGNAYVAEAKRQVFGRVGIDMIAGPSEVLIISDGSTDPDWLALDLLAQAEHDATAQSILLTPDPAHAQAVAERVAARLGSLARREIAGASWAAHGGVIVTRDLAEAAALADRIAAEHLQLCVADPEALAAQITHAGAIFLGGLTPEAMGDYVAGPNHVLPTTRSARFSSGLSVLDFMKRTTLSAMTPEAMQRLGPAAEALARAEGLEAHALSVRARLGAAVGEAGSAEPEPNGAEEGARG